MSRQRLVSEVVLRDALSCYAWYKTRLHSLRPMCKRIGLTSTMWSIKMRSLSMICDNEAVAEKQPRIVLSNHLSIAKERQRQLKKMLLTGGRCHRPSQNLSSRHPQSQCSQLRFRELRNGCAMLDLLILMGVIPVLSLLVNWMNQ